MSQWTTNNRCDLAKDCSYKDKLVTPTVFLDHGMWLVIRRLCNEVGVEWQMLLSGEIDVDAYKVTGYYIPKQKVSYASVEDEDKLTPAWFKENNIIATIHSHGNMNVFFSSTDDTNNKNSPATCHIVVNNKDEYVACVRKTLPCGLEAFTECKVNIMISDNQVAVDGLDRITKIEHTTNFATREPYNPWKHENTRDNGYGDSSMYPSPQEMEDAIELDDEYYQSKRRAKKKGLAWWNK